ncbi:MAG: EamA family transporter [Acidobacteriota bacterium]|nr:EamA family transporter [Acidobacteriota bacterium]
MQSEIVFTNRKPQERNVLLFIAAFAAVYLIWGSTYLAIKYALETLPPFLMAGTRFLVAGGTLYAIARFSADYEKPTLRQWRTSLIVGILLLMGGNGGVVWAQKYIPSGLAALLVAVEPLWIVLLNWLYLKAERPNLKVILGLVLGFLGIWLLIGNGIAVDGSTGWTQIFGALLVIGAAFSWACGSLYGLKAPSPKSPVLASGMQMLSGGTVMFLFGSVNGEWAQFNPSMVSANSILALSYLIVFGSIVAFTAYSWLLKNASPSIVSTYAYVNPVVAVLLGWALANETLSLQMLVGAVVIIGSVALINSNQASKHSPAEEQ